MNTEVSTLPDDLADSEPPWERYADNAWRRSFEYGGAKISQTLVITANGAQRDIYSSAVPPVYPPHVTVQLFYGEK